MLEAGDAGPQPRLRGAGPAAARVEPDALLGPGEVAVGPLDVTAERPRALEPGVGSAARPALAQGGGELGEEVGEPVRQPADGLLGGPDVQRWRDEQVDRQPDCAAEQRLDDPAGGARRRPAQRQDDHRADRDLEQVVPQVQRLAGCQRREHEQAEAPPVHAEQVAHGDREHHPGEHADDSADG